MKICSPVAAATIGAAAVDTCRCLGMSPAAEPFACWCVVGAADIVAAVTASFFTGSSAALSPTACNNFQRNMLIDNNQQKLINCGSL